MLRWLLFMATLVLAGCEAERKPPSGSHEPAPSILVDLNHATLKELAALPAVGEAYARRIVAGRPYANKTQLRSRGVVPDPVYERIQGMVIARQHP